MYSLPGMQTTKAGTARYHSASRGKTEAESMMFQERSSLVMKWFSKWNSAQRKALLQELLDDCSRDEQEFLHEKTRCSVPILRVNLAEALSKKLSLKILSYLDPRSLCRAAQVNCQWNWLCESNEIWLPKCNRLRWLLPSKAHSDIDQTMRWTGRQIPVGVYKRLYQENLTCLQTDCTVLAERDRLVETARRQDAVAEIERQTRREVARQMRLPLTQPVWRLAGQVNPEATHRFNVLDNRDFERMDARRKDPQSKNTMRSVVLIPSGKPKPTASTTARSPDRHDILVATKARYLQATRPTSLSESTTQTPVELWQSAAAAAASAATAATPDAEEDDDAVEKKNKKDKKKKKEKKKDDEPKGTASEDDGGDKKEKKEKKKKKGDDDEENESGKEEKKKKKKKKKKKDGEESGGEEEGKKKDKKKEVKKDGGDGKNSPDVDAEEDKKKVKQNKKKQDFCAELHSSESLLTPDS